MFLLIVSKYFRVLGDPKQGLIVGLGGGGLAMFFYLYFKQVKTINLLTVPDNLPF